jgi:MFS family permease
VPAIPRRWLIVAALFAVTFGISMPLAAYGVFLPIIAETFGWSRGAISAALSINLVVGGLAGYAVGILADRHGPRVMLLLTVVLAGIGFALMPAVTALWHLYVLIGVVAGVGMSSFYVLSAATVSHWFEERRGLAIALVLVGFNLGYMTAGPLAAWLISRVGWRPAYAVLGGGCAIVTFLAASSVRLPRSAERASRRPASGRVAATAPAAVPGVTLGEALRDPRYWLLNVSWLLLGGTIFTFSVHAVPFARDQGNTLAVASLALTAYGLGSVIGRLTFGVVSDRFGTRITIRVAYAIEIAALLVLAAGPTHALLLAAMLTFGIGAAATDTIVVRVIPDLFGLRAIGGMMGVLTLGWRSGAALGPASAGFVYDLTGSYAWAFRAAPAIVLLSWLLFAAATHRRRAK